MPSCINIDNNNENFTKNIVFTVDNKEYNLSIDNSRILYTNDKPYDATILELKNMMDLMKIIF